MRAGAGLVEYLLGSRQLRFEPLDLGGSSGVELVDLEGLLLDLEAVGQQPRACGAVVERL